MSNRHRQAAARCGSWSSPVSAGKVTASAVALDELKLCNGSIYWIERRPSEAGRCVIIEYTGITRRDILPAPWSARSRVHEYGGGAFVPSSTAGGRVFFINDRDQNIYSVRAGEMPRQITSCEKRRFADMQHDARRDRLVCICEDHGNDPAQPENSLVAVNPDSGHIQTLHSGFDFYSNPRLDRGADRLAWLCWNHPSMPWDSTELWRASLSGDGVLQDACIVAGGSGVSVFQPEWSPRNELCFVSDETGWWNLRRCTDAGIEQLTNERAEFGLPQWVFGQSSYAFMARDKIACTCIKDGESRLALLDTPTRRLDPVHTGLASIESVCAEDDRACFIAASAVSNPCITELDPDTLELRVVWSPGSVEIDSVYLSPGQVFEFSSRHNDQVHAIHYPPSNPDFKPLQGEKPPLIVICHGGPTACANAALDLRKQFWTSRGFALVDVNYSGSSGHGRAYRERLDGLWGVRDVEDCCDAALHLASAGLADASRLIIRGSSAGGFTVLAALTFHDSFAAGASYYGISELETLVRDTHKFESCYMDRLVGPYPEAAGIYRERSPIHHVNSLNCPVIFFQGLEDRVVPPDQAEKMVAALETQGIAVAYLAFEHEQHGFRDAQTITRTLEAELYFYSKLFGFTAAGELHQVDIRNR